jgi:biopolymer transport protein ExbD
MRKPSIFTDRRQRMDVTMTPMIDVVFLLLIFFLWSASFQIVEQLLPTSLSAVSGSAPSDPQDPPPPEQDFDQVVVRIVWLDGQVGWTMNDAPIADLQQLRNRLQAIADIKRDAPVILHPDRLVPLGDVIDVYDVSRTAGFQRVQFVASQDS